jgi:RNA recognition motif-containing protein
MRGVEDAGRDDSLRPSVAEWVPVRVSEATIGTAEPRTGNTNHDTEVNAMTKRLYVGNLPYETSERELETLFAQVGPVVEATVIYDTYTGRSRGFGFVEMTSDEAGSAAIGRLNNAEVGGRSIKVAEARPRRPSGSWRESYLHGYGSYAR